MHEKPVDVLLRIQRRIHHQIEISNKKPSYVLVTDNDWYQLCINSISSSRNGDYNPIADSLSQIKDIEILGCKVIKECDVLVLAA